MPKIVAVLCAWYAYTMSCMCPIINTHTHTHTSTYSPSLQYCLTDKPEVRSLDPFTTGLQKYPITEMQPVYFLANSFKDAKQKLM